MVPPSLSFSSAILVRRSSGSSGVAINAYNTTFVSRKTSPVINFVTIEHVLFRQGKSQLPQLLQRLFAAAVALHHEPMFATARDPNLLTWLQFQLLHQFGRNSNCEAIPPFRQHHGIPPYDIRNLL